MRGRTRRIRGPSRLGRDCECVRINGEATSVSLFPSFFHRLTLINNDLLPHVAAVAGRYTCRYATQLRNRSVLRDTQLYTIARNTLRLASRSHVCTYIHTYFVLSPCVSHTRHFSPLTGADVYVFTRALQFDVSLLHFRSASKGFWERDTHGAIMKKSFIFLESLTIARAERARLFLRHFFFVY